MMGHNILARDLGRLTAEQSKALQQDLEADFKKRAATPGEKCGECQLVFDDRNRAAALTVYGHESPDHRRFLVSSYLLCQDCADVCREYGGEAMENVIRDSDLAATLAFSKAKGAQQ